MSAAAPAACAVAIVGAGTTAREHARAFADVPGVRLAGIHSRTRLRAEKLAAELGIGRVCDSVAELHETTQARLIVVTVPELEMNRVARACFEYPWTVLLEKPAGYNLADAQEILASAREKKRNVRVALNRRFYASTRRALEGLAAEERPRFAAGGPRFIKAQDQEDRPEALRLGQPEQAVRNWMYANSIHLVDLLRVFGRGRVTRVTPLMRWDPERPCVVLGKVDFESGDTGLYEAIWEGPGPWALSVQTSARRWELRPLERLTVQERGERRAAEIAPHEWDTRFKPGFRLQAEQAIAAALGRPSDCAGIEDAFETMRLIAALYAER